MHTSYLQAFNNHLFIRLLLLIPLNLDPSKQLSALNFSLEASFPRRKAGFLEPKIMGNCMETCRERHEEEEGERNQERQGEEEEKGSGYGVRVKIVLTKEELEWMMFQLKDKGGKSLEDVLRKIERGRSSAAAAEKVEGWKPSLESIMESPEVVEMER
ncbi:hypothetical protein PVL29_001637 [Vitis rotundifolia]|uniref:Uncharacterized protein n=1 Tax=Vitis rotundifolia TaxID=103349 RepID=A0AA39E2S2_VITRO|nr:hypothetical protein PVL29_001637 [Vitis rotundifolia]